MTKTGLASAIVAVALLASGAVGAQESAQPNSPQWLKDRQYAEGAGVRAGDFEFHPGLAGEVGYDSNWFLRSSSDQGYSNSGPNAPVIHAAEFRVTPSLYLSTVQARQREEGTEPTPPMVAFRAGVSATYHEFIGLSSDNGNPANDISGQRNVGVSADTKLDIAPGRPVGLDLFGNYGRVIQPNAVTADPDQSFVYDTITAGAQVAFRPGMGTFNWDLGYQFQDSIFETSTGSPYDNLSHQAFLRGQWRFRPRTSLIYDATVTHTEFTQATDAASALLLSSTPVRVRFGIQGLVTDRFAAEATGGWGASFFDQTFAAEPQFDSFIGHAELKWFLSASPGIADASKLGLALSSIAVGYDRDFQSSYLGSYFTTDRGYLKFAYLFAGRALVTLEGGAGTVEYPELFWADFSERNPSFTDVRVDATLFGEYRFTDSLALNLTLRYTTNISDTRLEVTNTPPTNEAVNSSPNLFDMSWKRFESYLGLRWFL